MLGLVWVARFCKHTLAAVEKGKRGIWLLWSVDACDRLCRNGLGVQRLGLGEARSVLDVGFDGAAAPVPVPTLVVVIVIVSIELRRVLALLDLARGEDAEHGDLDLARRLGVFVVCCVC